MSITQSPKIKMRHCTLDEERTLEKKYLQVCTLPVVTTPTIL